MRELRFENRSEPVLVADGYGFKAPRSWGKLVFDGLPGSDKEKPEITDPLVASMVAEHQSRVTELERRLQTVERRIKSNQIRASIGSIGTNERSVLTRERDELRAELARENERIDRLTGYDPDPEGTE